LEIINPDDYEFMQLLVNSKGWLENIGDRNVHSKNDAIAYIDKIMRTENLFYWIVRIKEENTPIGIISFIKRSYLEHFDIGFALLPGFHNNGYAYEAAKAVLTMVSGLAGFTTILATTISSNTNSMKLLTKLGFRYEREIDIDNKMLQVYSLSA